MKPYDHFSAGDMIVSVVSTLVLRTSECQIATGIATLESSPMHLYSNHLEDVTGKLQLAVSTIFLSSLGRLRPLYTILGECGKGNPLPPARM